MFFQNTFLLLKFLGTHEIDGNDVDVQPVCAKYVQEVVATTW